MTKIIPGKIKTDRFLKAFAGQYFQGWINTYLALYLTVITSRQFLSRASDDQGMMLFSTTQ